MSMPDSPARAEQRPSQPVMVVLEHNRTGHEIKTPGSSFDLVSVVGPDPMLGGDAFTEVYFRTESGNVYRLDRNGELVNSGESREKGAWASAKLDPDELKAQSLVVGEVSPFSRGWWTTRVVEIVPTNYRIYTQDYVKGMKRNSIIEDFYRDLPSSPPDPSGFDQVSR